MPTIDFFVPGLPRPQGSLRSFKHARTGAIITPQDPKVEEWRGRVAAFARRHFPGGPSARAAFVDLIFSFPRPKAHYGTGKNSTRLKVTAPPYPASRPDIDKLIRAVLDALTGIAWIDDAQVIGICARKNYGSTPGQSGLRVSGRYE